MNKEISDERVLGFLKKEEAVKKFIGKVLQITFTGDLHDLLKNGITLCYLMQEIEPRSIPKIQEQTNQIYKFKENIYFFIQACLDFGVSEIKMFRDVDLLEGNGMVKVVECLVELANLPKKEKDFPALEYPESWTVDKIKELEPTRLKQIKEQLSKIREAPVSTGKKLVKMSSAIFRRKLQLFSNNKIDMEKLEKDVAKFQAVYRGHSARKAFKKRLRDAAYRERVAKEILQTEISYVESLGICIEVFLEPLEQGANKKKALLTPEQIKQIFSEIRVIHGFNTKLLSSLQPVVQKWHAHACLGDIFLSIVQFLKVYTGYVQNYNSSLSVLTSCAKNKKLQKFLLAGKDNVKSKGRDLQAFLIQPIQRIPRYSLLLNDLLKNTWNDHKDKENLQKANDEIQKNSQLFERKKKRS